MFVSHVGHINNMAAVWVGADTGILKGKFSGERASRKLSRTGFNLTLFHILGVDLHRNEFQNFGELPTLSKQDEICRVCWSNDDESQVNI